MGSLLDFYWGLFCITPASVHPSQKTGGSEEPNAKSASTDWFCSIESGQLPSESFRLVLRSSVMGRGALQRLGPGKGLYHAQHE